MRAGLLRYQNQQKSPAWSTTVRLRLPWVGRTAQGSKPKILTERDLVKASGGLVKGPQAPHFSRSGLSPDPQEADAFRAALDQAMASVRSVVAPITVGSTPIKSPAWVRYRGHNCPKMVHPREACWKAR